MTLDAAQIAMFGPEVSTKGARALLPSVGRNDPGETWIYFVQRGGKSGPIKIGFSKNLPERLRTLQTGSPEPVELLFTSPGTRHQEQSILLRFHKHRISGEWFRPTRELLSFIHACKKLDEPFARAWELRVSR